MQKDLLKPIELAARWQIQIRTLSQWRWNGKGPKYMKLGRHVIYRIQDIEEFERQKIRHSTSRILDGKLKQESDQTFYLKTSKS